MHSGYEIPGIEHHRQQQNHHHHHHQHHHNMMENQHHDETNSRAPVLLSMNQTIQTNILDQIHNLPSTTQQLFLDQQQHHFHHHLPMTSNHHYMEAVGGSSSAFYPVNFKLGLNNINNNNNNNKDGVCSSVSNGEDTRDLVRGSEQYQVPETRQHSLEMPHSWHNPQDSSIKQQRFWEPPPSEVSNENSEIIDRLENNLQMSQDQQHSGSKSRVLYGELEAIYKRFGAINQPGTCETPAAVLPSGTDHGSEASMEASACLKDGKKREKKKKRRKERSSCNELAEFFEKLVRQVVDHQENLHSKFAEAIERLDGERRVREEAWRSKEMAHFRQEAAARAREKASAAIREDAIVSYLEKITGVSINLPPFHPTES